MTPAQITAWAAVAQILIGAGLATWNTIKAFIESNTGTTLTATQEIAILTTVLNDAKTRATLALANAGSASPA